MLSRFIVRAMCLALLGILPAFAQEFRSSISGTVVDPQKAVVPNVKVTITNTETGAKSEAVSGSNGQYTVPFLVPGPYRIEAEAAGFKTYLVEHLQISTNERITQDIALQVGSQAESITIVDEVPMLTTATASTGQVITSNQVENLPMNGRTPLVLAQLAFGVIPNADPKFNRPFDNGGPAGFAMGGGGAQKNELLLDGTPDMTGNRRVAYNPPVDAVSEIKVETFQTDASYGDTGGGTVNVVMRGGTNQFHGTLYEFNQVSALAATPFFTNRAGQVKPVTRYNQYGGTVGGPIVLPKLYNGRNRLFFFFGYEGIKDSFPEPITTTVPTVAERNGDFSALLRVGANYQLYDPQTAVLTGGKIVRQPFPNNIIPSDRISPIAKAYLQYYPLPNQPGNTDGSANYLANSVRSDTFDSYLGRLDVNVSDKHKFFFNYRTNDRLENRNNRFNNIATGNFLGRANYGATFDDVYTFTPTLLLNTRFGWTRFVESNTRPSNGVDPTVLGFPALLASSSPRTVLPVINFGGTGSTDFNQLGDSGGDRTPFDTFQLFSTINKFVGSHSIKAGVDIRMLRESSNSFGNSAGRFNFDSNFVKADSTGASPAYGGPFAAFLLGLPSGGSYDLNAQRTNKSFYMAFFLQDDWRIRSNLTLNLGLRYEKELPTTERYNRALNGFDPTAVNRVTNAARAAYALNPLPELAASAFNPLGGVTFASSQNPDVYHTVSDSFSPRIGLSWTPKMLHDKTVIRLGSGIFYYTYGTTGIYQPGFSASNAVVGTNNSYLTPYATLANPFPDGINPPVGAASGINTFLGQNVTFINPNLLQPYSLRWSFSVQHQLAKSTVLEVGYIGNHGVHLGPPSDRNLNGIPQQYLSRSPIRDQATITRLGTVVPNPFAGLLPGTSLNGSTTTVGALLRPYPQFNGDGGVVINNMNDGSSYFHLLQVRLEKRFSAGLQFTANFAHSRLMDRTRRLNINDLTPEKRVSPDDRPNRFVASASYDLPFGRGKRFATQSSRLTDLVIGGWVLNTIYTTQSGAPLNFEGQNAIYYGGSLNLQPRLIDNSFDTTRFNTNSAEQLGSNVRTFPSRFNNLRTDIANNVDLSAIKNFNIREGMALQYRFEAFNAFNRAEFDSPDLSPTSKTFGKITNQLNLSRSVQMGLRLKF